MSRRYDLRGIEPSRALATAVIDLAMRQAKRKNPSARAWFIRRDSNFVFWCEALDLDPEYLSERVLELIGYQRS
jgi:hypothetical protein